MAWGYFSGKAMHCILGMISGNLSPKTMPCFPPENYKLEQKYIHIGANNGTDRPGCWLASPLMVLLFYSVPLDQAAAVLMCRGWVVSPLHWAAQAVVRKCMSKGAREWLKMRHSLIGGSCSCSEQFCPNWTILFKEQAWGCPNSTLMKSALSGVRKFCLKSPFVFSVG